MRRPKIDEEKAMAVRYIFEQYACDRTVSEIISSMTAKGMLHNGKPFKNTAIYKMLKNERYIGIYKIKDELFPNMYPKMIDEKIFEKVQKKTMLNKLGSRSKQTTYLFKYKRLKISKISSAIFLLTTSSPLCSTLSNPIYKIWTKTKSSKLISSFSK